MGANPVTERPVAQRWLCGRMSRSVVSPAGPAPFRPSPHQPIDLNRASEWETRTSGGAGGLWSQRPEPHPDHQDGILAD
jgi:hypothetical protein